MLRIAQTALVLLLIAFAAAMPARAELRLVMFEEQGCVWCERWKSEVGDAYHLTEEGRIAPLQIIDIADPLPVGLSLKQNAYYTPTFVLVDDGNELSRIEGYPGEDFFWGLLDRMLKNAQAGKVKS